MSERWTPDQGRQMAMAIAALELRIRGVEIEMATQIERADNTARALGRIQAACAAILATGLGSLLVTLINLS